MSNAVSNETVGTRIRRVRQSQGLSQRAIASEGITFAYISRIESGDRDPSIKALFKIAEKLQVSALYLLTGTDHTECPLCQRKPTKS